MKGKVIMNSNEQVLQPFFTLKCWKPEGIGRQQRSWRKLITKYRMQINTTLATITIGLMLLTGIWLFMVQLAECIA